MTKKKVPKKNVKPIILDIKNPNFNYDHLLKFSTVNIPHTTLPGVQKARLFRKITTYFVSFILVGVFTILTLGWINFKNIQTTLKEKVPQVVQNFNVSAESIKKLDTENASLYLHKNKEVLAAFNENIKNDLKNNTLSLLSNIFPFLKQGLNTFNQIKELNIQLLYISENLNELTKNGLNYLLKDGEKFIQVLENIKTNIKSLNEISKSVKNNISSLKNTAPFLEGLENKWEDEYLKYSSELYGLDNALDNIITLLKSEEPQNIALLFQNPAEIRPAGGFLGSYADIIINKGQIKKIDVRDIYDPDGQLDIKIVPPEELQATTESWGARDANWFFDFPTSAKTVLNFLNASKMYFEKNIKFDNAIAININVISSLLKITGPIKIEGYPLIDSSNILTIIQNETEGGKDKLKGEPKRIIKLITPLLLEKLSSLSTEEKEKVFQIIQNHINKKDIMFYSNNKVIQGFFTNTGIDGSVYQLPDNFWGNYLAVVNANIAGGKSDAFVKEDVFVNVDMDTLGNIFTNLEIQRTHSGNVMKESWWKANNNDYIQIFTEPNATLVDVSGNDVRKKYLTLNYTNLDYAINPDLDAIQKTKKFISNFNTWQSEQFGKNVFSTWLITKAGTTRKLKMRYTTNYSNTKILLPESKYTFIFEKQSGVQNSLQIKINAPFKYYWVETNSPVFTYNVQDPDKRTIITLTLGYNKPEE